MLREKAEAKTNKITQAALDVELRAYLNEDDYPRFFRQDSKE